MVEALRAECRLCEILPVTDMAKSSYEYTGNAQAKGETEGRAAARKAVRRGVRGQRRHTTNYDSPKPNPNQTSAEPQRCTKFHHQVNVTFMRPVHKSNINICKKRS